MTGVRIEPTTYTICGLPPDDVNSIVWKITVEWRGQDSWAVCRMSYCLSTDGSWDFEPSPSNRDDDFREAHRFTLGKAIDAAISEYPHMVINGLRVENGKLVEA